MTNDPNVLIARLQNEIKEMIDLDNDNILFDAIEKDGLVSMSVITINPMHNQSFLFHKSEGASKIECLEAIKNYALKHDQSENSYTIQWMHSGDSSLHTSYFRAAHIYGALEKLYHGSEMTDYKVFSITLNPIS